MKHHSAKVIGNFLGGSIISIFCFVQYYYTTTNNYCNGAAHDKHTCNNSYVGMIIRIGFFSFTDWLLKSARLRSYEIIELVSKAILVMSLD